jgi:hypothetical protein
MIEEPLVLDLQEVRVLNKAMTRPAILSQVLGCPFLLTKLINSGVKLIYIDEFSYSSESTSKYSWTRRGKKCYCFSNGPRFGISCMVAFSKVKIELISVTAKTFTSEKFQNFLKGA